MRSTDQPQRGRRMPRMVSAGAFGLLALLASFSLVVGASSAASAAEAPAGPTSSRPVNTDNLVVSVDVSGIPGDVTAARVNGAAVLTAHGTTAVRVVSPDLATLRSELARRSGTVLISGSSSTTNPATSTTTRAARSASPSLSVGYGCLVQTWPGTNVHPCGYVVSNAVAKGIFNALKVLGSAAAVTACTGALMALHVDHGTAASLCGTAAAILAGFANWGSQCMLIISTPRWLAGHIVAVNC